MKEKIKERKKIEWELVRNHSSDLLTQDLILGGFYKHCDMSLYGASFKVPFVKYEHRTGDVFWAKSHMDNLRELSLEDKTADKLISDIKRAIDSYKKYLSEFKKEIYSGKGNPKVINEWFDQSQRIIPLIAYFVFEESLLKDLIKEGFSPKDIPSAKTDVTKASEEIIQLKRKFNKEIASQKPISSRFKKAIQKVVTRYSYLGMKYFSGHPWTIYDVYQMILTSYSLSDKKFSQKKYKSKTIKYLAELLRLRTVKWEIMCYSISLLREYINRYFNYNYRYEDILNFSTDEVIRLTYGDYSLYAANRKYFTLTIDNRGYYLSLEKEAAGKSTSQMTYLEEVSGTIAYAGKVTGRAKIILSPKDAYKIKPGDVLVATMSTPDFLPAMQRAAAFVTDIGGITSHAAIVSREMRKPCIIGTKIATKVLKDGDLVEVDANKGIVRKIK